MNFEKEILSELLDAEQFWQSFGAFKLLQSLVVLQVFTPLYRGVKWTLSCQRIQKESFEALINHQWFIAWYVYCPMKDQFQMHSMYEGTLLQAELLSLSCSRDKLCVVEIVVVHFVQFVLCQRLTKKQAKPMHLNPFKLAVVTLFHSFAILRRH